MMNQKPFARAAALTVGRMSVEATSGRRLTGELS